MQNGHVESFNGRLRDECLNANWFRNLLDARAKIAAWRDEYNGERPHSSLGYRTPNEFAGGPEILSYDWLKKSRQVTETNLRTFLSARTQPYDCLGVRHARESWRNARLQVATRPIRCRSYFGGYLCNYSSAEYWWLESESSGEVDACQ